MLSKNFKAHELVPKRIYEKYGDKSFMFIDKHLIITLDLLKETFNKGSITINNYYWKGNRQWSGLRLPDSPYYRELSQHSFGRAADCIFSAYDVEEVRRYIINNTDKFKYIGGIEMGASWLHIDTRNSDKLVKFKA